MNFIFGLLNRTSIRKKLHLLGSVSIIFYIILLCADIYVDRVTLYTERHKNLHRLAEQALSILDYYNQRYLEGEITLHEAKNKAKRLLDKICHGPTNGYFILKAATDEFNLIGQSNEYFNAKDIANLKRLLKKSQEKDYPVKYLTSLKGVIQYRVFQAKLFKPWNWIVGTGERVIDLEDYFLRLICKKTIVLLPILLFLTFLLYFTAKSIVIPLDNIKRKLQRLAQKEGQHKNAKPTNPLNTEVQNILELINQVEILRKENRKRLSQITILNDRLTKYNHELVDFSSIISHDLQTPLRKISLLVSTIRYKAINLTESQLKTLEQIVDLVIYSKTLIHDILSFSQLSSQKKSIQKVDLKECVKKAIELNDIYLEHIEYSFSYQNLPVVKADKNLITQLFYNLINNAIKYRDQKRPLEIQIESDLNKNTRIISFIDNGIGVKSTSLQHIFKPFGRATNKIEGKGLGLAICKKIVTKHNGNIWAKPRRDKKGLIIQFTLKEKYGDQNGH